jgi:hypothetical protein
MPPKMKLGTKATDVAVDLQASHRPFAITQRTLNESTSVGVKIGGSRSRGSRAVDLGSMVTGTKKTVFTQVRALLMEVKPYVLLLFILMEMYQVQS